MTVFGVLNPFGVIFHGRVYRISALISIQLTFWVPGVGNVLTSGALVPCLAAMSSKVGSRLAHSVPFVAVFGALRPFGVTFHFPGHHIGINMHSDTNINIQY